MHQEKRGLTQMRCELCDLQSGWGEGGVMLKMVIQANGWSWDECGQSDRSERVCGKSLCQPPAVLSGSSAIMSEGLFQI